MTYDVRFFCRFCKVFVSELKYKRGLLNFLLFPLKMIAIPIRTVAQVCCDDGKFDRQKRLSIER